MGKLKEKSNEFLAKSRTRSQGFVEEQLSEFSESRKISPHYMPIQKRKSLYQRVVVEEDYYGRLPQRDQTFIDFSEAIEFDYATLLTGPVIILSRTVPVNQAWFVDDVYFFATAMGGITNSVLLGAAALIPYFAFEVVLTGSNQLKIDALADLRGQYSGEPLGVFPFLNDRVGPRQAIFGLTLFEGETIMGRVILRPQAVPVPPPAAIQRLGFRFSGLETPKSYLEETLRRRRWNQ